MRIAVNGAAGAMGRRIVRLAAESGDCCLVAALERTGHPDMGKDAGTLAGVEPLGVQLTASLVGEPEVLIDFTIPESTVSRARECAEKGIGLVIGTTGLSASQQAQIEKQVAARVPVLIAPNMSLGVNLLFTLVESVAKALPPGYDIEVIEAHHNRKKDAPSGTAMEIGRRLCAALGRDQSVMTYGRHGMVGARTPQEIAIHAVRAGDIVGEHTVIFAAEGERIELTHRASSRDLFARGALQAARFIAGRAPGLYSMQDVLA